MGKTAVVTGANSGIACAFAKVLLKEGYTVFAVDKSFGNGLEELSNAGARVSELDVTSEESISRFQEHELNGNDGEAVDLLLNIAGIAASADKDALETSTLSLFEKTFAVNTFGPFLFIQALLPNILKSSSPKIGIVSSRVGSVGDNSTGGMYSYRASKAAVNSIGKSMAMDLKDKGVVVMLLHPGFVRTNLLPDSKTPPDQTVDPPEAAEKLWKNIVSQKGIEDTGKFWHREGYELPW